MHQRGCDTSSGCDREPLRPKPTWWARPFRTVTGVTNSDGELLRAHLGGCRYAFDELVRRHQQVMWTVARRCLDDERDAAEAVQDALVSAHQSAARYRGDCAVRTWLLRILVNRCRDRHRYNRRRITEQRLEPAELARLPMPRDAVEDRLDLLMLRSAMEALSFEQRAVILLVNVLGQPVEEVAVMLGVSVGTVKSRGARARERLRELLADDDPVGRARAGGGRRGTGQARPAGEVRGVRGGGRPRPSGESG